jgi:hypothetical protein
LSADPGDGFGGAFDGCLAVVDDSIEVEKNAARPFHL